MFDQLLLKSLAVRQLTALKAIPAILAVLIKSAASGNLKKMFSCIMVVVQLIGVVAFDFPGPVLGDAIDMSQYALVWSDEFNSTTLDPAVWQKCNTLGTGEIFDESMMSFDGENLIISTKYLENGPQGAGWYTYGIQNTTEMSNFTTGYYEVRCKVPAAKGMWSAFWMLSNEWQNNVYKAQKDWIEYTEIDVMESFYYGESHPNSTINTVHHWVPEKCDYDTVRVGKFRIDADPYNEYVTYGALRTETETIFYINGKESGRTDNGCPANASMLLLTVQVDLREGSTTITENDSSLFPANFVVDYVRCYKPI